MKLLGSETIQARAREPYARVIATGRGFDFWKIGAEVYRAPSGSGVDTDGLPMSKRWECSVNHWKHFRMVFNWAIDQDGGAK